MFGAALAIGGGLAKDYFMGKAAGQDQQKWQKRLMEKEQAWKEKMRSSAHQTEVEDLRKAGLNPILSAGGSGAVTPGGGVPSAPHVNYGGSSASEFLQMRNTINANKKLEAETRNINAQTSAQEHENKVHGVGSKYGVSKKAGFIERTGSRFLQHSAKYKQEYKPVKKKSDVKGFFNKLMKR